MLELEILFVQLFPEAGTRAAPFTLREIGLILSEAYKREISYHQVHRAFSRLLDNPNTSQIVRPLESEERELLFSAPAARRIARRVVGSELPAKYRKTVGKEKKSTIPNQSAKHR
jgi:hypothetical protein